jgi:6-pyruvoyltetrahydropterin/6-carboxytetrahydropterin synthase
MKQRIIKRLHFCYGHRLMDYDGKCARAHGHNGVIELVLKGPVDSKGMVYDFTEAKRRLMDIVEQIDHRMLLREDDPMVEALRSVGEDPLALQENPTAETIAKLIYREAQKLGLPVDLVRLWETRDSCAEYPEEEGP